MNELCDTLLPFSDKFRITHKTFAGGLASGLSTYFAQIAENFMNYDKITKEEFCSFLDTTKNGSKVEKLWKHLAKGSDVWTLPSPPPHLPHPFRGNQPKLNFLCKHHRPITNNACQCAIISFAIGVTLGPLATILKQNLSEWGKLQEVIKNFLNFKFSD